MSNIMQITIPVSRLKSKYLSKRNNCFVVVDVVVAICQILPGSKLDLELRLFQLEALS